MEDDDSFYYYHELKKRGLEIMHLRRIIALGHKKEREKKEKERRDSLPKHLKHVSSKRLLHMC